MSGRVKRFAAVISPRWREPSTCEACGGEFTCGATLSGCWCSKIKLSDEQRAELRGRFEQCVCRNCLEGVASGSANFEDRDVDS